MKTASLPSIRVEPELRDQLEGVLANGETVSAFVEASVRQALRKRQLDAEFHARGIKALEEWRVTGEAKPAEDVLIKLEAKLAAAKAMQAKRRGRK